MIQIVFIQYQQVKEPRKNKILSHNSLLDETKDDENNNSSNNDDNPSNDEDNNNQKNENENENNDEYHNLSTHSSFKDKHVRRPMNSFMLFSQEQRAKIHLANPNRDNRNVSKILGEKWYSLSPHEQEQYRIKAKQLRNEHLKQNPSFKWTNQLNKFNHSFIQNDFKDEQEQCRRSARLQSQSNQEKNISPYCDRLQAFAQVIHILHFQIKYFLFLQICTNMPKLTEESTQCFTPITKPSSDNNTSTLTNVITPVPIHGNSTPTSTINNSNNEMETNSNGIFQYRQTAFRVHSSLCSNEDEIKNDSLSNSPQLKTETKLSENETCRTIVSMLINQRKTNLGLEQQLKHLQSSSTTTKATTSQSPTIINSSLESNSNLNQSLTIKRFSLDEHQQRNFTFQNSQYHFLSKTNNKNSFSIK